MSKRGVRPFIARANNIRAKIMKKLYILILTAICFFNFSFAHASFIEGLEDVPLLDGMKQLPSDTISFGNEESRLVEVLLTSDVLSFKTASTFYQNTMPQMGWIFQGKRGQTLVFEREGEVLEVAHEADGPLLVRITVKSKI